MGNCCRRQKQRDSAGASAAAASRSSSETTLEHTFNEYYTELSDFGREESGTDTGRSNDKARYGKVGSSDKTYEGKWELNQDTASAECMLKNKVLSAFLDLHPDVCDGIVAATLKEEASSSYAYGQISELMELCSQISADSREELVRGDDHLGSDRLPGGKVQPAAFAAMMQHGREMDRSIRLAKCLRTIRLMGLVNMALEEAKLILLESYPKKLQFGKLEELDLLHNRKSKLGEMGKTVTKEMSMASTTEFETRSPKQKRRSSVSSVLSRSETSNIVRQHSELQMRTYDFERHDSLDREGRPIYKNPRSEDISRAFLAWHRGKFGGHWAVCTDEHGGGHGDQSKWSTLPFDSGGDWTTSPEADKAVTEQAPENDDYEDECAVFKQEPSRRVRKESTHSTMESKPTVTRLVESAISYALFERNTYGEDMESTILFASREELVDAFVSIFMTWSSRLRTQLITVLLYLIRVLGMLNEENSDMSDFHATRRTHLDRDKDALDRDGLTLLLTRLAEYAHKIEGDNWEKQLATELPGFPFELSFVQLVILNCRFFGMSRIRSPYYPHTLIRLHDFVFRAWQQGRVTVGPSEKLQIAVRYLDLHSQELRTMVEAPEKPKECLRFVVVSDTHGWELALARAVGDCMSTPAECGRIVLPQGDILLHCGDLLNEGMAKCNNPQFISRGIESFDDKIKSELSQLSALCVRRNEQGLLENSEDGQGLFKWVFLVGGNHDAPLHMLASSGQLTPLLGDSVILLQSPAEFDPSNPFETELPTSVHSVTRNMRVQSNIFNGAVRLLGDCTLCPPQSRTDEGVVLAGSGLSLANSAWSANRAFQIQRHDSNKLRFAAEQLVAYNPDIVMTHGPPAGFADEKRGDEFLRTALDESSAKLHFFGHAHSNGIGKDDTAWNLHGHHFPGRCFVNASIVTSMYLPTRLPIVVDLPVLDHIGI